MYILSALLSVVIGFIYAKLEENLNICSLLKAILIFIFISVLLQFFLISFVDFKPAYFFMMVFKDILWMFVGIEFGMIAGTIFDIRQGKRLFGLLVSGEIIAGIIGGLSIGAILEYIDTKYLLLLSSLVMLVSFVILIKILNDFKDKFNESDLLEDESDDTKINYKALLSNKYYVAFFIVSILAFLVFYLIDFMFYFNVEQQYPDEKELAKFFGVFYALLNIVNLISSFFISGRALSRYGIAFGLLAIPVMATIGSASLLLTFSLGLSISFFIIVVIKLLNEVIDISILAPSFKIVYQSIPQNQRNNILTFRETFIEPMAMGFAGIILILLTFLENKEIIYFLIIAMSIVWIIYSISLKKGYVESLKKITEHRYVLSQDIDINDIGIDVFVQKLQSENYIEVIYALETLKKVEYKDFHKNLLSSINHPNTYVRAKVLDIIYELNLYPLSQHIAKLIKEESDEKIKAQAIILYCKLKKIDATEFIQQFLKEENTTIKNSAMIGLLKYCGIDGILLAGEHLNRLFESKDEKDILNALEILRAVGQQGYVESIRKLLMQNHKNIKLAAIKAVGDLKLKKFIKILLLFLYDPSNKKETISALKKFGLPIFKLLKKEFNQSEHMSFKESLITILASFKDERVTKYLFSIIKKEPIFFDKIITELYKNNFKTKDIKLIESLIDRNNLYILELLANLPLLDSKYENSIIVIKEQIEAKIKTAFLILSFLYPTDTIEKALNSYKIKNGEKKAYSIELLDNILSTNMRKKVIYILESSSIKQKVSSYNNLELKIFSEDKEFIKELLNSQQIDSIVKLSLIYEIGKNKQSEYLEDIDTLDHTNEAFFEETITWTQKQLGK